MKRLQFATFAILALLLSNRAAGSLSVSLNYPNQVAAWTDYYVTGQINNSSSSEYGSFNFDRQVLGTWHSIYGGGVPPNSYADIYNPSGLPYRDGGNQIITYRVTGGLSSGSATLILADVEIVGPPEYALTVNFGGASAPSQGSSGTGGSIDGYFPEGTNVTITAATDPQGRPFANWTVVSGPGSFTNANVTPSTFVMGAGHATIQANYQEPRTLTVQNGTGGGTYYAGNVINISANQPPLGQIFSAWSHVSGPGSLANASASATTFTMGNGNAVVNATYVTAPPPPTITKQPMDLSLVVGQTFSVYVFVAGATPFSFQWYKNGSPISGATSPTYYIDGSGAQLSHAGTYTVVISNAYGTVTSNPAVVTVDTSENLGWGTITPGTNPGVPPSSPGVGALAASVSVDNKGSANGSMPLKIPPGRSGLQPSLSLNYSSSGGNGPLGTGWSLSTGFPQAITRGRSILARDNEVRGVTFTSTDKFYLDGKRLICVSGTYGMPGSVYRTEVDSFVTITTAGTGTNIDTFVVTDKSGTKMTFGKLGSAVDGYQMGGGSGQTLAYAYALKQVEDAIGNTVVFNYSEVTNTAGTRFGEYVLAEILYTGGLATAQGRVAFHYNFKTIAGNTERLDRTTSYIAGRLFAQSRRLDGINVEFGGERVGYYSLDYEYASNGGPLRLASVTPYLRNGTGAGFTSFAPTQMTWSASTQNYTTQPSSISVPTSAIAQNVQNWGAYWNTNEYYAFADVNGDGIDDLVQTHGTQIMVSIGTGAGAFATGATWSDPGVWSGPAVVTRLADINGDGRKDIVFGRTFSAGGKLYALISNGSKFVPLSGSGSTPTEIYTFSNEFADSTPNTDYLILKEDQNGVASRFAVADFTGDGCDDILIHRYNGLLKLIRWNGNGFDTNVAPYNVGAEPLINEDPWMLTHNGSHFTLVWLGLNYRMKFSIQMHPCELNGDGIMDYAWVHTEHKWTSWDAGGFGNGKSAYIGKSAYAVTTQPNGGFSTRTNVVSTGAMASSATTNPYRNGQGQVLIGDVNGDGLTDFLTIQATDVVNGRRVMQHNLLLSRGTSGQPSFQYYLHAGITPEVSVGGTTVNPYADPLSEATWSNNSFNSIGGITNTDMIGMFLSFGLSSSGDNMYLHDVNHDGRQDYLWYVHEPSNVAGWWVMYSQGTSFAAPVSVPSSQIPWNATPQYSGSYSYRDLRTRQALQLNGDGIPDYAAANIHSTHTPGVDYFHISAGQPGVRLAALTDGLGRRTDIAYKPITDSTVYTPGAAVSYPIREVRSAQYVVSDLWYDSGTNNSGDRAQFSYQYSGNRLDLSGRGSLGFHAFVTLDRQTNLFKYQFLAQSFPMTGLTHRDETYRWHGGTSASFDIISSHDNTVVFDKVATGGGATLWPFISQAIEYRWENGAKTFSFGGASGSESRPEQIFGVTDRSGGHITITAESRFDNQTSTQLNLPGVTGYNPSDYNGAGGNTVAGTPRGTTVTTAFSGLPGAITHGNLRHLSTNFGGGFTETVATDYEDGVAIPGTSTYYTLTGRPKTVTTTVVSPGYGTESAPIKRYTYWGNTPLPATETIDATDNKLDLTTTYARDGRGRVTSTTVTGYSSAGDPQHIGTYQASSATAFNDTFDLPTTTRNADPYLHTTTTAYHPFHGLPTSVTGPNADSVTTEYDALGRTKTVTDVLKNLTTTTDFAFDSTQTVSPPSGVTGLALTSAYKATVTATAQPSVTTYYDRLGRAIRTVKESFSGSVVTDTVYNKLGQVVATSLPYPSGGTKYWTTTTYDALGRVVTVTAPNGTVTTNGYFGRATRVSVDAPNLGGIDPAAQVNTTLVDAKGRTVKVWNADNVPSLSAAVSDLTSPTPSIAFALDGFGRMRSTTLLGQSQQITASYDAHGRQTSLNDPDKGNWTYLNNALGQVVRQQDANANVTVSTFDRLGRPLVRTTTEPAAGPVETAKWFYYDTADNASLQLVAKGAKGWIGAPQRDESSTAGAPGYAAANSAVTNVRYYDEKGRPSLALTTLDGKWFYTFTGYDTYSRVAQVRHYWRPANLENATSSPYVWQDFGYTYAYNSKSYLLSLTDSLGRSWWDSPVYDHLDRVTSVRKGSGHTTVRAYRPTDGVLESINTGGGAIQNLGFIFDGLGNLKQRTNANIAGGTETLTYDILNRLTHSTKQGSISYQANGNILGKTGVAGETTADYTYHTTTKPHAVNTAFGYTHSYDANGNLTSRTNGTTAWTLKYAGFDKPRWMAKGGIGSEFLYNANRSRTVQLEFDQMSGGVPSRYVRKRVYGLGPTLEANYEAQTPSASPTWVLKKVRIYVSGPDGMLGAREFDSTSATTAAGTEKALVYHHDHLGSIESITPFGSTATAFASDTAGKSGRFSEDAWGQRRDPLDWAGAPTTATDDGGPDSLTPRGFTGHEMLDDLGLVHMNGRIYDPLLGRMLSADLLVSNLNNLQNFNRYSYLGNNPLSNIDPSGFESPAEEEKRKREAEEARSKAENAMRSAIISERGVLGYVVAGEGAQSAISHAGAAAYAAAMGAGLAQTSAGSATIELSAQAITPATTTGTVSAAPPTATVPGATPAAPSPAPAGPAKVPMPANLLKTLQSDADGQALIADIKAGNVSILVGDSSKLSTTGIKPTMGRSIPSSAAATMGLSSGYVAFFDPAYTAANSGSFTYEEMARAALINEHKAYVLRNDPAYVAADARGRQLMELAADKNLGSALRAAAVGSANKTYNQQFSQKAQQQAIKNGTTPPHPTAKTLQIPPGATLWTVP